MRKVLLAVTACLVTVFHGATAEEYITAKDRKTASDADRAVTKYCTFSASEDVADADEARQDLVDALGGKNPILDAMTEAEDPDDFGDQLATNITDSMMSAVFPFFLAGVCLVLLGCYCCTALPCCKCIRCCGKSLHKHNIVWKVLAAIPVGFAFLMTIVGSATSSGGSSTMVDGFNNMACESAVLLNSTLQGQGGTYSFIGLMPALQIMKDVEGILSDNSDFMTDLDATLADTKMVSDAVEIATQALNTMSTVLTHTADYVKTTTQIGYTQTYRECQYCSTMSGLLGDVSTGLSGGIGQALANARNEVKSQLTGDKRAELQNTIRQSALPMIEMKKSFVGSVGALVKPDSDPLAPLKEIIPLAVSLVFMGAFFVTFCGMCSSGWCIVREYQSNGKPSKGPHRIACCAWSLSFIFAIFCFVLGGILSGVSIPLASICLIMDDVDGQMVRDIAPALDLNVTGQEGQSLVDLLDNCINPANKSLNANFLDLIRIPNETDGTNESMRALMQTAVSEPIEAVFDAITSQMSSGDTLAGSQEVLDLLAAIDNNPIQKVIVVNGQQMLQDTKYEKLAVASDDDIKGAAASTLACADHTVEGNTLNGMSKFITAFNAAYSATTGGADFCGGGVTDLQERDCTGDATPGVCAAGNEFKKLFGYLVNKNGWRCDIWEAEDGSDCDVFDMDVNTGSNCLHSDGTMRAKEKTCSFSDFKVWYGKNKVRIQKSLTYVDNAVAAKSTGITTDLKDLVFQYMINPLFAMFDGLSCGFLPGFWQATVDSLCFQGVYGLRRIGSGYNLTAFFVMILAISMYILWRRTIDNVNNFSSPVQEADLS